MTERVHVLHVVRTLGRSGGMERNLFRVVKALRARGIEHSIALLSDFPDIIDFGELADVTRIVTPPNDPRLILELRAHMQAVQPTVVHARTLSCSSPRVMCSVRAARSAASEDDLRYALGLFETYGKDNKGERDTNVRPIEVFMCSVIRKMGYADGFRWLAQFF